MASTNYVYQSLPLGANSIRLLRVLPPRDDDTIRCELFTGNVSISEYTALSYVWGSSDETFPIELSGKSWRVRKSLQRFLKRAQQSYPDQPLWIDALCINQDDIPERNQQVSQMCKIYNRAKQVLVWLEDDPKMADVFTKFSDTGDWKGQGTTSDSIHFDQEPVDAHSSRTLVPWQGWADPCEPAGDAIPPLDIDSDALEPWSDIDKEAALDLFTEIGNHSYWTRSWVVQEFCLAREIVFAFETMEVPFMQFERTFLLTDPDANMHPKSINRIAELVFWRQGNSQLVSEDSKLEHPTNLYELLVRFGSRHCQDSRDRIFSLVGMSEEPESFRVDYSQSKQQLFISVLRFLSLRGKPRSDAAMRLLEIFEFSLADVTSELYSLPVLKLTYPVAGAVLVLNGAGGVARSRQLWLCKCHQCQHLSGMFKSHEQIVLVKTPLPNLWLLYSLEEVKSAGVGISSGDEDMLRFKACASPFSVMRNVEAGLCAYIPEHSLLKLYHFSRLMIHNDGSNFVELLLDEKSVFVDAFCASLQGSASVTELSHSSMQSPSEVKATDHGPLGIVRYGWDWNRIGVTSSDKLSTTTSRRSIWDVDSD